MIPRCYRYQWPHVQEIEVKLGCSSVLHIQVIKGIHGNMKGSFGEHEVLNAFIYLCESKAQPAFIFHNFKFLNENNTTKQEADIIIVHRDLGIILVEIKSGKRYSYAKIQLDRIEILFKTLFKEVFKNEIISHSVIKKVIVFPFNNSSLTGTTGYYILHESNLKSFESFDNWWRDNMVGSINSGDSKKIYDRIIPELFKQFNAQNNSKSSYNNLVIAEVVHQLKTQSFLKDRQTPLTCMMSTRKKKKSIDPYDVPMTSLLNNVECGKEINKSFVVLMVVVKQY